jgi:hypothetical protein
MLSRWNFPQHGISYSIQTVITWRSHKSVSLMQRLAVCHGPKIVYSNQWRSQDFFGGGGGGLCQEFFSRRGGVQQIQLRTEGRENGDMGAVAP